MARAQDSIEPGAILWQAYRDNGAINAALEMRIHFC